jgi:hypothetical protein
MRPRVIAFASSARRHKARASVHAELGGEPVLVAALAGVELAAVPPRGAPADAVRLEHDRIDSRLGEVECRRQPRIAAADDGDMGADVLYEPRKAGAGSGDAA